MTPIVKSKLAFLEIIKINPMFYSGSKNDFFKVSEAFQSGKTRERQMIQFSSPAIVGNEEKYIKEVICSKRLSGDHSFTDKCNSWLARHTNTKKAFITTSCTHALEMAALLTDIKEGDEIIMPSYTFVSTANAFVLRGARIVFVDIRPDTMNMDENLIEQAVTDRTKAIVPVHYAGVGCDMDTIIRIAIKYDLFVIEDAAQGMMSKYNGRALGAIGNIGAFSFHETKNYTCGEGGAILINDERFVKRAEIIREKGTNRSQFFRGEVDKYNWQELGSSWLPSELNAAFLFAQLEMANEITDNRLKSWTLYHERLRSLEDKGLIERPKIPFECEHNGHIYFIKVKDLCERTEMIKFLKGNDISAMFHYIPLHSSNAGLRFGRFCGEDRFTTKESERLLRLPLYYDLSTDDINLVCTKIEAFFKR